MIGKKLKIVVFLILVIVLTYFVYINVNEFFAIDSCLDKGCQWNYSLKKCDC
jgi:hypothetical protein